MASSPVCDHCDREVASGAYTFRRHQGILVFFTHKSVTGHFCRDCASRYFWRWTPVTLLIGWPGYISIIAAPLVVVSNLFQFVQSRFLPKPDASCGPPVIDEVDAAKLHEAFPKLVTHIERVTGDVHLTASKLAAEIGVRPAQVVAFLKAMHRAATIESSIEIEERKRRKGFEVVTKPGEPTAVGANTAEEARDKV